MKKLLIAAAVVALTSSSAFAHHQSGPSGFGNTNTATVTAKYGGTAFVTQGGVWNTNTATVSSFGDGSMVILIQD